MKMIIEGPEGSGKTTLIEKMKEWQMFYGFDFIDFKGNPKSRDEALSRISLFYSNRNIIFDRHFCIGEQVYGPILRKETLFPKHILDAHLITFLSMENLLIYCEPPSEHYPIEKKGYKTIHQLDLLQENQEEIHQSYFWIVFNHPHLLYNYKFDPEAIELRKSILDNYVKKFEIKETL